mmetsp:Transcript_42521/g.91789  ORF Transcript_42521/g.91789 Transcript_42521/m.91789 type:complete len:224 (-) Transcript_42521:541-1212(-)
MACLPKTKLFVMSRTKNRIQHGLENIQQLLKFDGASVWLVWVTGFGEPSVSTFEFTIGSLRGHLQEGVKVIRLLRLGAVIGCLFPELPSLRVRGCRDKWTGRRLLPLHHHSVLDLSICLHQRPPPRAQAPQTDRTGHLTEAGAGAAPVGMAHAAGQANRVRSAARGALTVPPDVQNSFVGLQAEKALLHRSHSFHSAASPEQRAAIGDEGRGLKGEVDNYFSS